MVVTAQPTSQKKGKTTAVAAVTPNKGKGSIASQLGALNAANASAQAFAKAAPNSRVGKLRTYAIENAQSVQAAEAAAAAQADLADAQATLQTAQEQQATLQQAVTDATTTVQQREQELTDAQTALSNLAANDPAYAGAQQAVTDAQAALGAAQTSLGEADGARWREHQR